MKRFLVCLDASPRAPGVLAAAVDWARQTGAKLQLLRVVVVEADLPPHIYSLNPDQVPYALVESAQIALTELAREIAPDLLDGVFTQVGPPWHRICEEARDRDADLVILGAHGHTAIGRMLGTTASKVVNHIDRPVLIVRPPEPPT
jgi:nucleotide-binding universal stress UspA family protein